MSELENPLYVALKNHPVSSGLLAQAKVIGANQLKSFLSTIDESPYDLNEWAISLIAFEKWATENRRDLSLDHKIEYLSCCLEGARGGVNLPLEFLLTEYLNTHGVE